MEVSEIPDVELCQLIGEGSFGLVRLGHDKATHSELAVKLESLSVRKQLLHKEFTVMSALRNAPGIPAVYSYGVVRGYSYMTMQLLGNSLSHMLRLSGGRLMLQSVLKLAQQMITTLECVHRAGYIHRDMKPQNFLLGLGALKESVYLIDFGLARRWLEGCTSSGRVRDPAKVTGTMPYVSLNMHLGRQAARRDDLESLAYVFIYLLKGELPWHKHEAPNISLKQTQFLKESIDFSLLCQGLPIEFQMLLKYARSLSAEELPDYSVLRKAFRNAQLRLEAQSESLWLEVGRTAKRSKSQKSPCRGEEKQQDLAPLGPIQTAAQASPPRVASPKQRRRPKLEKEKTVEKLFEGFTAAKRIPALLHAEKAPLSRSLVEEVKEPRSATGLETEKGEACVLM